MLESPIVGVVRSRSRCDFGIMLLPPATPSSLRTGSFIFDALELSVIFDTRVADRRSRPQPLALRLRHHAAADDSTGTGYHAPALRRDSLEDDDDDDDAGTDATAAAKIDAVHTSTRRDGADAKAAAAAATAPIAG